MLAKIEASEMALMEQIAGTERPVLLDVIRAIDSIGYLRAFAPNHRVSDLPGYLDICWLGANRALSLFLPAEWSVPVRLGHLQVTTGRGGRVLCFIVQVSFLT
ncbi:hypothetical protein HGG75_20020 [Ochrobactrum pseudogrignonense]|nr:hypothetical protein [Brucella pseudogrignonensis]